MTISSTLCYTSSREENVRRAMREVARAARAAERREREAAAFDALMTRVAAGEDVTRERVGGMTVRVAEVRDGRAWLTVAHPTRLSFMAASRCLAASASVCADEFCPDHDSAKVTR